MAIIDEFANKKVCVITADGRTLVGNLCASDHQTNLVLQNCVERVIREPDDPDASEEAVLGLYIVRGDNICVIGLVDEAIDDSIDWTQVRGAPISGTKHS